MPAPPHREHVPKPSAPMGSCWTRPFRPIQMDALNSPHLLGGRPRPRGGRVRPHHVRSPEAASELPALEAKGYPRGLGHGLGKLVPLYPGKPNV